MTFLCNNHHAEAIDPPGYEISTADALSLEPDFHALVVGVRRTYESPSFLIETLGASFPALVPARLHQHPVWVVSLPDECTAELAMLRKSMPAPVNILSIDLLQNKTFLAWPGASHQLSFEAADVERTLNGAAITGHIVVMFLTPSRLVLTTLRVDDEFMGRLSAHDMSAGSNYSPFNVFSSEELEAARVRALGVSDQWAPDPDEEGRANILLPIVTVMIKR